MLETNEYREVVSELTPEDMLRVLQVLDETRSERDEAKRVAIQLAKQVDELKAERRGA